MPFLFLNSTENSLTDWVPLPCLERMKINKDIRIIMIWHIDIQKIKWIWKVNQNTFQVNYYHLCILYTFKILVQIQHALALFISRKSTSFIETVSLFVTNARGCLYINVPYMVVCWWLYVKTQIVNHQLIHLQIDLMS